MQQFAAAATLATLALSIFVGVRLLLVALRTRGAPEIAMGTYQAFVVAAIVLYTVLRARAAAGESASLFGLVVVANLLIALGVIALAFGILRIYRSSEPWAALVCGGLSLWVLGGWLWTSLGDTLPTTVAPTLSNVCFVAARSSVYLWGGYESVAFHRMMRRRVVLGLADPVVAHQILLWGCFSLSMGTLAISSLAAGLVLREAYAQWTPALFITPAATLVASICLWLGFFPPGFYRRLIAARSADSGAGAAPRTAGSR